MPQLTMPNIGEGIAEGTVTRWLKQEGDTVALDDPVVEVETDKAVVEIPCPFDGVLSQILVPEGGVVPIGAPLAEFQVDGASAAPGREAVTAAAGADQAAKAAAAPAPPREAAAQGGSQGAARSANGRTSTNGTPEGRTRRYSPVVLKLAAENDIDLELVRGTGIEGRVTRQDVLRYLENPSANTVAPSSSEGVVGFAKRGGAPPAPPVAEAAPSTAGPASPSVVAPAPGSVSPLSATRRTIAAHMSESHRTIPVAWMALEADVTGLVALRESAKDGFQRAEGVKLTYLPFFVQVIVGALKDHPALNATYVDEGITRHAAQHVGIAVATEWGLVVPVIRDAGTKSIAGLARELDQIGEKARARKLAVDDMRGATFTIDNTGAFGSITSQPIVPMGQVAIITTEAIRRELRPLAGDAFGARSVMNLCISFDHRALDGAEAGAFMQDVKRRLESYEAGQQVY